MSPVVILLAALGSGGLTTIVVKVIDAWIGRRRPSAEVRKLDAEAGAVLSDATTRRYDALFEALEAEIKRRQENEERAKAAELKCLKRLDDVQRRLDESQRQIGELRVEAANATADTRRARDEIVRLQDRLDNIEKAL